MLPLAVLPLVLHLLYRRKSPVVLFPTLRFIQSSLQQAPPGGRSSAWLLLAIRMLLLALLIWAIAQPAKILASRFFGSNLSTVAIVVVDTSWSMQYLGTNQTPLITEADQIVQQLLRDKLRDASVMLATSASDLNRVPFRNSSELLAQWVPLKPEPACAPLFDAVSTATEILSHNPAAQKLLVVISDFQATDFPRPLAADGRCGFGSSPWIFIPTATLFWDQRDHDEPARSWQGFAPWSRLRSPVLPAKFAPSRCP